MIRRNLLQRNRRGTVLLEFVLALPFAIFLIIFAVDAGRYINAHASLGEATHNAARTLAQTGGQADETTLGAAFTEYFERSTITQVEFNEANPIQIHDGNCTTADPYVEVSADGDFQPLFGALYALAGVVGVEPWDLETAAVARCEIVPFGG